MKAEGSSGPSGDISPIAESLSNLPDASKTEGKATEQKKPTRKSEPAFEKLPNFSRVTPAQLAHVVFPGEGRYQPVRPVSAQALKSSKGKASTVPKAPSAALGGTAERYAGGGGILILIDQAPSEPVELVEPEPMSVPVTTTTPAPSTQTRGPGMPRFTPGPHIALDENGPDADQPQPFEVWTSFVLVFSSSADMTFSHSITSTIPRISHNTFFIHIDSLIH